MRAIRRNNLEPRVEMVPLIDVIFLLLTFFIYSFILAIRTNVLPMTLLPIGTGQQAEPGWVATITIDRYGVVFLDGQLIPAADLDMKLHDLSTDPGKPRVVITLEALGGADRGPILVDLIERIRRAGIEDVSLVGPPKED
ncbi:MAG: biopolymer transporter ExbD [Phycisphaeraceae bacterium]|nr:biopolymer transporter ExbD [Phycisphaeraceae bacterium]